MDQIKTSLSQFAIRIIAVVGATFGAALLAYFRSEASKVIKWSFGPILFRFPWHRQYLRKLWGAGGLASDLTVVDVLLTTDDGRIARYQKTADYVVVADAVSRYSEGVTASGKIGGFATEMGVVQQTQIEHGFHVSQIDLGAQLQKGTRFRNVYRADLLDSFIGEDEHWSQEIVVPTKRLIIRIHFPLGRPPLLVRCKRLVGLSEIQVDTEASRIELFGQLALVWEIRQPLAGDVYKLEWRW